LHKCLWRWEGHSCLVVQTSLFERSNMLWDWGSYSSVAEESSLLDVILCHWVSSSRHFKDFSRLAQFDREDEGTTKCWEILTQWHIITSHKTWIFDDISGSTIRYILNQYANVYLNLSSFNFLPLWMRHVFLTIRSILCIVLLAN
jgi:hypothetical protein